MFINWGLKDLADRMLEKQLQDKLAEGREEGREEYRLWHERYEAARERGEEFEEPPPGTNHG